MSVSARCVVIGNGLHQDAMFESVAPFGAGLPFLPTLERFPPLILKTRNLEILRSVVLILDFSSRHVSLARITPSSSARFWANGVLSTFTVGREQADSVNSILSPQDSQRASVFVVWMRCHTKNREGIG